MISIRFQCDNKHLIDLETSAPAKMVKKSKSMKIVCPACKPANVQLHEVKEEKYGGKQYVCSKRHLTIIHPFTSGYCNVTSGDDSENIEADPDLMQEMIDDGVFKCQHKVFGKNGRLRQCKCKLKAVDNEPLDVAISHGIKTKVRVGDIWDKAGCPEPKDSQIEVEQRGGVDFDAKLNESEFSRRNKRRVNKMRRQKNERNTVAKGDVMKKSTNRNYRDGNVRRPTSKDIKGRD